MKILFNTYPFAFQTPGGGEVQLQQYKKFITEKGIDIGLFNQWKPELEKCDLLHFFSCMPGSEIFLNYVKSQGIPVLISPNLWISQETKQDYPFNLIQQQLGMADRVVCNSKAECELLSEVFNLPIEKFICVYNGVDEIFFEKIDQSIFRKKFQIEGKFILNVANIEPRKNQLSLVRALKKFPDLKLVIMGGIRDNEYANKVISEGGKQLLLIPRQEHGSDIQRSAYAACQLFALPSTLETPGLAALEAGATGASILITQNGCTKEYFGDDVTYIDPDSVENIENGIVNAISNPSLNIATVIKENFTWPKVIQPLVECYKKTDFFGKEISSNGFFFSEISQEGSFIWSKYRSHITTDQGVFSFQWRAPQRSNVNIYLNQELFRSDIEVGVHWENFTISTLESQTPGMQTIEFEVTPLEPVTHGDARDLGIAFLNIHFES